LAGLPGQERCCAPLSRYVVERRFIVNRKTVKASLFVAVLGLAVLLSSTMPALCGGWIFGVRPGSTVESAFFGADMGTVTPIVGLDFLGVSVSVEDDDLSASMFRHRHEVLRIHRCGR